MDIHPVVIRYMELNGYPLCVYSIRRGRRKQSATERRSARGSRYLPESSGFEALTSGSEVGSGIVYMNSPAAKPRGL